MTPYIRFVLELGGKILTISKKSVFRLVSFEGIEASDFAVTVVENGSVDGGYIQSVQIEPRTTSITFAINDITRTEELRIWLIKFFTPKAKGILTVSRGGVSRQIGFNLASRPEFRQQNIIENKLVVSVPLICPDPYFYDVLPGEVRFLTYNPLASFPLTSMAAVGATTGLMTVTDTVVVENNGDAPVGVICEITATGGPVSNPRITCNGSYVRVIKDMTMDDTVKVDTRERRKNIYVNGISEFIFDRTSVFFSLPVGKNTLTISADTGLTNATTTVSYTLKYYGV